MEFLTVRQVSQDYGISTRMLRYYEQIGLLESKRIDDYAYRVYDETAIKKLQQIIILRKLQIPMKQIKEILNNQDAVTVVEIFKQNISELDEQITALSTVKSILSRFVEELQEKADVRLKLDLLNDTTMLAVVNALSFSENKIKENISMEELINVENQIIKRTDIRIIYIPPMTIAASYATGENCEGIASTALNNFVLKSGLIKIKPDVRHFGFDCSAGETGVGESSHGYEMWVSIPNNMNVPAPLIKRTFHGGLYAAYMIKMGDFHHWNTLREWVNTNGKYTNDWGNNRWAPFVQGMEHCLEEQLNFLNNIQNPNFNGAEMQLDLLFPIREKSET